MSSFVIGVSGRKGSGKSYASECIRSFLKTKNINAVEVAVAKALKLMAASIFYPCTKFEDFYSNAAKEQMVYEMPTGHCMVDQVSRTLSSFLVDPKMYKFESNDALALFLCEEFCCTFGKGFWLYTSNWLTVPRTFGWVLQNFGTEIVRQKVSSYFWANITTAFIESNPGFYIVPDVRYKEEEEIVRRCNGKVIRVENTLLVDTGSDGRSTEHASETSYKDILPDVVINNTMNKEFDEKLNSYVNSILKHKK